MYPYIVYGDLRFLSFLDTQISKEEYSKFKEKQYTTKIKEPFTKEQKELAEEEVCIQVAITDHKAWHQCISSSFSITIGSYMRGLTVLYFTSLIQHLARLWIARL